MEMWPQLQNGDQRDAVLKRLEYNARAHERAKALSGANNVHRDITKAEMKRELSEFKGSLLKEQKDREARWREKMQGSPLTVDLWAADQRQFYAVQKMNREESLRSKLEAKRQMDAFNAIRQRATMEHDDSIELRAERRELVTNTKLLRATQDAERKAMQAAKVLQSRVKDVTERQNLKLQKAISSQTI